MPIYVYECASCNNQFEVEQRITEDPLADCTCGALGSVRRLIQPIAVMFKGTGFHINDYASKPGEAKKEETNAEAPKTDNCTGTPESCPKCEPAT